MSSREYAELRPIQKGVRAAMSVQRTVRTAYDKRYYLPKVAERLAEQNPNTILDIGSGKGHFGDALKTAMPNINVVSTDMVAGYHEGKNPFIVASGYKLPFVDNAFDVSTIFYTLHHLDDPIAALKEAQRVSKKIIVQEDTHRTTWQKRLIEAHVRGYQKDASFNGATINTDKEWQKLFSDAGLKVKEKRRIRKAGYPVPRYEYHLEPKQVFPEKAT